MNLKRYDLYLMAFLFLIIVTFTFMPRNTVDRVVIQTDSGNVTVNVEVADDNEERVMGLMYREELPANLGMLFIFQEPKVLTFWMKNTLIPLDMLFISGNLEIIKIDRDVPPCAADLCPNYGGVYGKYVLEVNAGFTQAHGIMEGDKIHLILNTDSAQQ
jgi:uncharacterized membrane protein (UPF0127 family)